jgi:hypothetical protein
VESSEAHFFGLGDWGGYCNYMDNICTETENVAPMPSKRGEMDADKNVQQRVAASMKTRAQKFSPEFTLSLGDHFYPGGVDVHCGSDDRPTYQWNKMFESIYDNETLGGDWMGVLGNHDYGGSCFTKGWDQQISYTWWGSKRWVMPAQYWKRKVQFAQNFVAEFFFLDTNLVDAEVPDLDPDHNICSQKHNEGKSGSYCPETRFPPPAGSDMAQCKGSELFPSIDKCHDNFKSFWARQKEWLEDALSKSTADWQIVVTHYPPSFPPEAGNFDLWPSLGKKYGIDLMITGHTHSQQLFIGDNKTRPDMDMSEFPYVISGGGGGVFSEGPPSVEGDDDEYGFVDFKISKESMDIVMISHTGTVRRQETIHPRQPAAQTLSQVVV